MYLIFDLSGLWNTETIMWTSVGLLAVLSKIRKRQRGYDIYIYKTIGRRTKSQWLQDLGHTNGNNLKNVRRETELHGAESLSS